MGGCKCSYRNCTLSSLSDEKIRYFHFPIKDRHRCEQWIINAQKPHFHTLPVEKLRNKVICQYHFESKYFMNPRHDRLTHNAIPTIDPSENKLLLSDMQIVPIDNKDQSNDSTDFALITPKNELLKTVPTKKLTETLDLNKTQLNDLNLIPISRDKSTFRISSSPPVKKVKVNVTNILLPTREIKTEVDDDSSQNSMDYATLSQQYMDENNSNGSSFIETNEQNNLLTYTVSENGELNLVSAGAKAAYNRKTVPLTENNIKLTPLSANDNSNMTTYSICLDELNNAMVRDTVTDPLALDESQPMVNEYMMEIESYEHNEERIVTRTEQNHYQKDKPIVTNENKNDYIRHITENTRSIQELTSLLTQRKPRNVSMLKQHRIRKKLLFKHLSKGINPILAVALKMELFPTNDWDSNEKRLAMDLYNSTPDGYKVLVEKWDFKLPPLDLVQEWSSEKN